MCKHCCINYNETDRLMSNKVFLSLFQTEQSDLAYMDKIDIFGRR